ncbi:MAG: hypothetical protein RLZZ401_2072 [Pseudomonadota bacterium]|jgi:uncharacterized protein YjeT (DUF2065 family)
MDSDSLWLALALVLVIEGLLPFVSPAGWRRVFTQLLQLHDGQIRFFGFLSIVLGLVLIWIL